MAAHVVNIFHCQIDQPVDEKIIQKYLSLLPSIMQHQLQRYHRWQDRQAGLIGKLLLQKALNHLGLNHSLKDIQYSYYRKPFLPSNIKLNISHSENFVVCALSESCDVGIDIECIRPVSVHDFKTQMTDHEWNFVMKEEDCARAFYKYWTEKEAVIKADGRGLSIGLKSFEVINQRAIIDGVFWYTTEVQLNSAYSCHVATNIENYDLNLFRVENPFE